MTMTMVDQSHGRPVMRRRRKLIGKVVRDDICACVRFILSRKEFKCFKLKIPSILIQKLEEVACCSRSKRPTTRSSSANNAGSPHYHPPTTELYPCTHSRELANCTDKVVSQRYVQCEVDPKFNGPFSIPIPLEPCGFSVNADFASIGSVLYALGGNKDHFDPSACKQISRELFGYHPTNVEQLLPRAFFKAPPIFGGKRLTHGPVNPPPSCTSDNICYHTLYCDFSKPDPQWEMSSQALISPRLIPKLVSLKGMLFAFGGNSPSDHNAPFAEVFDPSNNHWEPLPRPPFGRLSSYELSVFPLPKSGRILVLGFYSYIEYLFDISTWSWRPFEVEPISSTSSKFFRTPLSVFINQMRFVKPVLSVFNEHLYWLNRSGRLCVYNVGDGEYYEGFITGLRLECHAHRLLWDSFDDLALLPLSQHLMGLFWFSYGDDDDLDQDSSCVLHLTILHVSFLSDYMGPEDAAAACAAAGARPAIDPDCQPHINLTAFVVACLSFPLEGYFASQLVDAYLMNDGEGNMY